MAKSANKILKSTNGETILESIASLLIFTVLMVAVTSMVASSLKMTAHASTKYITLRENVTKATMFVAGGDSKAITFSLPGAEVGTNSPDQKIYIPKAEDEIEIAAEKGKGMNIFAFYPQLEEGQ